MRLTRRTAALALAVALAVAGIVTWAATGAPGLLLASGHAASASHGTSRARARPRRPRRPAGPVIVVAGAPQGVKAKGAVLADAVTGQVLWGRGLEVERPMASITKVMTALVVLQAGDLGREIRVPKAAQTYAFEYGGETAGLYPGDVLTAQDLLNAMLLASGADAAYTLATTYGPGMPAFIATMNATAARMGMTHTHFASPDGLPYPTETSTYSTPSDLLILGLAAMRYPAFRTIVDQQFYHLPKGPGHHQYWWDSTSDFVGSYTGAVGIKDGYTDDAGLCLLFEAVRNGRELIGVVLDSPATVVDAAVQDAERLLNWGFGLRQAHAAIP
jgi:serine-type D-Ala-D-Ala carboxypeptidase (penicillin-binding protein 5/6)